MRICFDTETPTRYYPDGVPDLVCLTWATEDDKATGRIAIGNEAIDIWEAWLADPTIELYAHNAPFDCCVLAKASAVRAGTYTLPGFGPAFEQVFQLYESGRLHDTIPRQRLIDVAQGRPGDDTRMGTLAKRLLHIDMGDDKDMPKAWKHLLGSSVIDWPTEARDETPWRFKYELLEGVPLEHWPDEPRRYACEDPVITWGIADWQDARAVKVFGSRTITNAAEQTRAALDLHLTSVTGFATDRPRIQRLMGLYRTVESVCAELLVSNCALCGRVLPPAPEPKEYKAAIVDGALPGDARLGDCSHCRERVALIREDVKFRGGRKYRGVWQPEQRKRVKDKKAARRLVWATLGAAATQTKKAKERGLPRDESTVSTDADTLIKVAATMADGREGLLNDVDTLAHAEAGTLTEAIAGSSLPVINAIRLHSRAQKYLSAFLAPLDTDRRVRTSYQTCKDTGRTSARTPNVQNFPRPGTLSSELTIRSCIVSDPGDVFLVCDYAQIELVGFAHVLNVLGRMRGRGANYESKLSQAINAGMDGHIMVAAEILHMSYDECLAIYKRAKAKHGVGLTDIESSVMRWRQVSKIQNYGAAGGMGAATFVAHASKQDAIISLAESHLVREAWLRAWSPDVPDYFRYFGELTQATGRATIVQLYSQRVRGKTTFTQCCNTMFQGLCADGAKAAMRLIVDACYRNTSSPLYGCRVVMFVHDEFVLSCPTDRASVAGPELSRLMISGMRQVINDVKIEAECSVMTRWGKG